MPTLSFLGFWGFREKGVNGLLQQRGILDFTNGQISSVLGVSKTLSGIVLTPYEGPLGQNL